MKMEDFYTMGYNGCVDGYWGDAAQAVQELCIDPQGKSAEAVRRGFETAKIELAKLSIGNLIQYNTNAKVK